MRPGMYFSDDIIAEVRAASDIVDVVSDYVRLKKKGSNFFGLCPFHQEKTPSFSVNPELGIFKCFGCGAGGDVFRFVREVEGMSFPEAVRTLAYYGEAAQEIYDVGVAGLWRLLDRLDEIRAMPVVIAVAGMEASLPSVVGGQVPGLVVAVPTSNGYGVSAGGRVALDASLSSCAPGLAVVNIDNGYGAACVALRALRVAG